jgi:twitching motility two-component system response regulator PilG
MRLDIETETSVPTAVLGDELPSSQDTASLVKKGIAAAQKGDREHARELLTQAAGLDPSSEDAWMWLASISDYPEELLAFLNKVLAINPSNERAVEWHAATRSLLAKTFVQRGIAAHNDGSHELAGSCFDQALDHDANYAVAWMWKARAAGSDDEKVQYLERVLEIDPDNEEANAAIAPFREPSPEAKFEEAKWAAVEGKRGQALALLDEVLEKAPGNAEAWVLLSHLSLGLTQKLAALEKALEIDPENAAARAGYDFLNATVRDAHAPDEETNTSVQFQAAEETAPEPAAEAVAATVEETAIEQVAPVAEAPVSEPAVEFVANDDVDEPEGEFIEEPVEEPVIETVSIDEDHLDGTEVELAAEVVGEPEFAAAPFDIEALTAQEYVEPVEEEVMSTMMSDDSDMYTTEEVLQAEFLVEPTSMDPDDIIVDDDAIEPPLGAACAFCDAPVETQAFECGSCHAVLTLSDIESLLANTKADQAVIQAAVTRLSTSSDDLNVHALTVLGIGYFNLRSFDKGFSCLQEASRLDPNNVILAGQVNALAIRLDEIRRQNEIAESKPKGKTILVVDDSPTVRKLISAKLEKSGHNVTCASDGVEGLEMLATALPDLVLLDIAMPRMDGYEVCKEIRSNPAASGVPIVMISGKDGFFDKVRGKMAGCTGYVTKPFGPETLMKALETYLLPENGRVE